MRMILMTLIFNLIKMTLNRMTLMQHKFLDLRYLNGVRDYFYQKIYNFSLLSISINMIYTVYKVSYENCKLH